MLQGMGKAVLNTSKIAPRWAFLLFLFDRKKKTVGSKKGFSKFAVQRKYSGKWDILTDRYNTYSATLFTRVQNFCPQRFSHNPHLPYGSALRAIAFSTPSRDFLRKHGSASLIEVRSTLHAVGSNLWMMNWFQKYFSGPIHTPHFYRKPLSSDSSSYETQAHMIHWKHADASEINQRKQRSHEADN